VKNGIVYILLIRWNYSWIKWKQKNKCWFDWKEKNWSKATVRM